MAELTPQVVADKRDTKGVGFQVRHDTARSCLHLVPLLSKPIPTVPGQPVKVCPSCQVHHPCKTLHLWLDDTGSTLVSQGVLDLLSEAGMPNLTKVGHTVKPPPLKIGDGTTRQEQDYGNRTQLFYGKETVILDG